VKLNRREFLAASAAAGLVGSSASAAEAPPFLVVVVAAGGWDVTYCFDPKNGLSTVEPPDDPDESTTAFGDITVQTNETTRPMVSEWFQRWSPQACVVNGIVMGTIAHDPCRTRILTGTTDVANPDVASIMGFTHGADLPLGSVDLSGWSITGYLAASAGRVGVNNQIKALIDPTTHHTAPAFTGHTYPLWSMDRDSEDAAAAYLRARAKAFRRTRGSDGGRNDQLLDDLHASADRAVRFRDQSGPILDDLALGSGATMQQQMEIAASMLAEGLCMAVTVDSKQSWDTHDNNPLQHGHYNELFAGLDLLARALESRGILQRTVVAVVSEMTRTPKRNGANGKDHWGHTSALLFGGPVKGNQQLGATSDNIESVAVDLVTGRPDPDGDLHLYESFAAGLLSMVGVDSETWLPGTAPWLGAMP